MYKKSKQKKSLFFCTLALFIFASLAFTYGDIISDKRFSTDPNKAVLGASASNPLIGAIRWDAWFTGGPGASDEIALTPPQWHDRLPFYATVDSASGEVRIRLDDQSQMDQEIAAAKAGGIDYWAFDYYGESNSMSNALNKYKASSSKGDIRYSLIVLPQAVQEANWPTSAVNHFQDTQYVRVLNNRPLVYVFAGGGNINTSHIGALRNAALSAGIPDPYIVWMTWNINDGKVMELGLDAVSSYANAPTGPAESIQPYSNLMSVNQQFSGNAKILGLQVIPIVNTGWDPRPRYAYPPPWGEGTRSAVAIGSPSEIVSNLETTRSWMMANPYSTETNTIIMYAWNEFAEGGWLTPLLNGGSARLDAIAQTKVNWAGGDIIAPNVSISSPTTQSDVSNIVSVSANASDNVGIAGVQFQLDGTNIGQEINTQPFTLTWNTRLVTNGNHALTAIARDASGNVNSSSPTTVNVANSIPLQPVGLWKLNENTGITTSDFSDNNNHGSLVGGASWSLGKRGNSVSLNGIDGYVNISDNSSLDGMNAVTVSAWVNLSMLPVQNFVVVGKDSGTGQSYRITIGSSGSISFTVKTPNNAWYSNGTTVNSLSKIQPNVWKHITGTYDGSILRLYIDGRLERTGNQIISGTIFDSVSPLRLGYKSSSNIDFTTGRIDEVILYSVALTSKEIKSVFEDTSPPTIQVIQPINGANLSGLSSIEAAASDESGISKVEFYVDGVLKTTDSISPFSTNWDTTAYIHNSSHSIYAKAFDIAGYTSTSTTKSVTVTDTTAPNASITSPLNNSTVAKNNITVIQGSGSDISGISKMEFLVDGDIKCTDTISPYNCNWEVPNGKNIIYSLQAKAYDVADNSSASSLVSVTSR